MTLAADGANFIVSGANGLLEVVSLAWLSCELQLLHVLVVCFVEKMILSVVRMCS